MNSLVVIFALATCLVSAEYKVPQELKPMIKQIEEECARVNDIDQSVMDEFHKGEFPDYKEVKCFMKCAYEKFGAFNQDGEFNVELIKEKFPQEDQDKHEEILKKCAERRGSDLCETAYEIDKCYFSERKEL